MLTTATAWLVEHAPAPTWDSLELRFRVAARLVARRDRDALTRLFAVHLPARHLQLPSVLAATADLVADLDLGLPPGPPTDEMLRLTAVDLPSSAQLDDVTWSDDGRVTLRGIAFVAAPAARPLRRDHHPARSCRPPGPTPTRSTYRRCRRTAPRPTGSPGGSSRTTGARASPPTIDVRRLVRASDPHRPTTWRVSVDVDAAGVQGRGWFAHRNDVGTSRAGTPRVVDDALVVDSWHRRLGWQVTVHARHAAVLAADVVDGRLRLRVHVGAGAAPVRVLREDQPVETRVTADPAAPQVHDLEVALADLAGPLPAPLRLDCGEDRPLPLVAAFDLDAPRARRRRPGRTSAPPPTGPCCSPPASRTWSSTRSSPAPRPVRVTGRAVDVDAFTLRLAGSRANGTACEITVTDGRFSAEVPTTFDFWDRATSPLWRDLYALEAQRPATGRSRSARPARWSRRASGTAGGCGSSPQGGLAFRRVKDVDPDPSSSHGRQVLRTHGLRRRPARPAQRRRALRELRRRRHRRRPRRARPGAAGPDPDREVVWSVARRRDPGARRQPGGRAGHRALVRGDGPGRDAGHQRHLPALVPQGRGPGAGADLAGHGAAPARRGRQRPARARRGRRPAGRSRPGSGTCW